MPDHTTNAPTATDSSPTETETDLPVTEPLGDATVTIDVPAEVARDAWRAYQQAVSAGYAAGFDTFLFNHTSADWSITVDGADLASVVGHDTGAVPDLEGGQ